MTTGVSQLYGGRAYSMYMHAPAKPHMLEKGTQMPRVSSQATSKSIQSGRPSISLPVTLAECLSLVPTTEALGRPRQLAVHSQPVSTLCISTPLGVATRALPLGRFQGQAMPGHPQPRRCPPLQAGLDLRHRPLRGYLRREGSGRAAVGGGPPGPD
jgi:hypothetical protein